MERSKWLIALLSLYPLFLATACHSAEPVCDYSHISETLSTLYLDKDPQKAMKMIRSCAEKGDSASQIALASVYLELPDKHRSEKIKQYFLWSKKATVDGGIVALNAYGIAIYVHGTETGLDSLETMLTSLDWYLKAAEWGHPQALYKIGSRLKSYSPDEVIAYTFLTLAKRRANPSLRYYGFIIHALQELEESPDFSKEDIAEAIRLADIWEHNHPEAAKSWPSDDWVENMKGESAKQIPVMTSPPTSKTFCDIFGEIMMYCPQESQKTEAEMKALRPGYVEKH